jgi:hypothetical protein
MEQEQRVAEPVNPARVAVVVGAVLAAALLGWLVAFGANAPCVAAVSEARRLGDERVDPFAEDVIAAVRDGSLWAPTCAVLSVRLRAFGKNGVHVEHSSVELP